MALRHQSGVSARRYKFAIIFSLLCACFIAWGCQTTPVSGRRKLALLTPEPKEIQLGFEVKGKTDFLKKMILIFY